jgi:hypothetical protein
VGVPVEVHRLLAVARVAMLYGRRLRNSASHPVDTSILPPGSALAVLRRVEQVDALSARARLQVSRWKRGSPHSALGMLSRPHLPDRAST